MWFPGGELFTAAKCGLSMKKVYFHGNNKSPDELEMAVTFRLDGW